MKKTEIMRRFFSAAAAVVIAVTSVNFTAVTSFAEDTEKPVFTDVISSIDLSEYEVGRVLTVSELADLGLKLGLRSTDTTTYELPVATVEEGTVKLANVETTRKYIKFSIVPKKTYFSLSKAISITGVKPNSVEVSSTQKVATSYNATVRDSLYKEEGSAGSQQVNSQTRVYKRSYLPQFDDFAQLGVDGKIVISPRFNHNEDNPSNDGLLYYANNVGGHWYNPYNNWFVQNYTLDYKNSKLNTYHTKPWTTSKENEYNGSLGTDKLPSYMNWNINLTSLNNIANDADASLNINDIVIKATYDANDTVKGTVEPDAEVTVKISNSTRGEFWSQTITADTRGNYSVPVNFEVCGSDAVVTVVSGDDTIVKKAKYANGTSEKVLDMESYTKDENAVYFADLKLNGGYSFACVDGASVVSGSIESVSKNGDTSIVAAVYSEKGEMKQLEVAEKSLTPDTAADFSFNLNTVSTDTIKLFVIDNYTTAPTIIASSYEISTALSKKDYTSKGTVTVTGGEYSPVSMAYEVTGEYTSNGYIVITAENGGVKYFGVYENELPQIILPDKKANEKNYTVKLFDSTGKKDLPSFEYVSSETFNGYFATLNSADLTLTDFTSVINAEPLKIDNADYNSADGTMQENVLRLFKAYKAANIERVAQVQEALDKAIGVYIFVNSTPSNAQIKKYASSVAPAKDKTRFDAQSLSDTVLASISAILSAGNRTEENISTALTDAFIAALVRNASSNTEIEEYISSKYSDYVKANTSVISKLGLDRNEVYNYILANKAGVSTAADVKALFEEAVNYIRSNSVESGIVINGVKFLDANGEEHTTIGDYLGQVKARVSYTAPEGKELSIVLSYYKNSELLKTKITTITTDATGVCTTEALDTSKKSGKGEYRVEAKLYSSLASLTSCTDETYGITETLRTNVLEAHGYDFGGFEQGAGVSDPGSATTWSISNMWVIFEGDKGWFANQGLVTNVGGYNENVRSGNYAAWVQTTGEVGGIAIHDSVAGPTVTGDQFKAYWPVGDKGVAGLLQDCGPGKYKLTAYVKTGLNSNMRLAVNYNRNRTYGNYFKTAVTEYVEKGKWTKIETEFRLNETVLNSLTGFSVNITADSVFDDEGNATDFASQIFYVDDVSLVKLDEEIKDESANLVVKGTAQANEAVEVMIVNTAAYNNNNVTNADVAFVGNTTADENGKFNMNITFDGEPDDYSVVVKCGNKTYLRSIGYAVEENGKKIVEVGYFDVPSVNGAYIENISIDGQNSTYSGMKLPNGASTINASVYSIDKSSRAVLFASVFNSKGEFKKAYTSSRTLVKGMSNNFSVTVNAEEGDSARIFLVDGVENMNLMGNAFEISDGLSEFKTADSAVTVSDLSTKFSPSSLSAKVSGNISKDGYVTAVAVDKGAAKNVTNFKFADFCKASPSTRIAATVTLEETTENNGKEFDIYLGNCSGAEKQTFTYKMSSSYQSEYDKLNNSPSASTVESVISNPELDIDMTKVNMVPSAYRTSLYSLFISMKPSPVTSVVQIQKTLDDAAEIVIATVNPTAEFLAQYGEKLGLNSELFNEFVSSDVSDTVRNDTAANMKSNIPATITKDTLNKSFESAYVASYIKNVSKKYQDVQSFATNKFKAYIGIDETRPSNNGKTLADVFKEVYKSIQSITSTSGLVSLYNTEADKPKTTITTTGSGVGSGTGGGGGRVPSGVTMPSNNANNETTATNEIFVDIDADYWAAPSILKLKNKGVVSEDKYYRPNDNVSREEFVKMIAVGFGLRANGSTAKFIDMVDGAWYEEYVMAVADNGVAGGIGDNMFGIGQSITRQDAAVIIGRIAADKFTSNEGASFNDEAEIADYAKTAVAGLSSLGIINGYEDSTFRPSNSLTRAECAKIIAAVLDMAD